MRLKFLFAMVVGFALSLGAIAQQTDDGIKQDTKDAAHSTGKAAKKTGHKVKKGTKKVVHKSADATREGRRQGKRQERTRANPAPTEIKNSGRSGQALISVDGLPLSDLISA